MVIKTLLLIFMLVMLAGCSSNIKEDVQASDAASVETTPVVIQASSPTPKPTDINELTPEPTISPTPTPTPTPTQESTQVDEIASDTSSLPAEAQELLNNMEETSDKLLYLQTVKMYTGIISNGVIGIIEQFNELTEDATLALDDDWKKESEVYDDFATGAADYLMLLNDDEVPDEYKELHSSVVVFSSAAKTGTGLFRIGVDLLDVDMIGDAVEWIKVAEEHYADVAAKLSEINTSE
jgi:outer membrane murein-binding lipoprotein Lpp